LQKNARCAHSHTLGRQTRLALADWEFEPLVVDGRPMAFIYIPTVRFGVR
jgi:hypothetical protein